MPLVAMNDYVSEMEDLKIPSAYPLALNGLGADYSENDLNLAWNSYLASHPGYGLQSKAVSIQVALNDGDVRTAQTLMSAIPGILQTQSQSGNQSTDPFSALSLRPDAFIRAATPPSYVSSDPYGSSKIQYQKQSNSSGDKGPSSKPSTIDQIFSNIQQLIPVIGSAFPKRAKQKIVVQKDPDYTTYAVIAGAVIVTSVLLIAISKSGSRRRD